MKALLIKLVRQGLGQLVIFISFITRPQKIVRSEHQQTMVDEQLTELSLYQHRGCPFCTKVRRAMHRLNLNIQLRDITNSQYRQELAEQGGLTKVPCLRIEQAGQVTWMYESNDIIAYLDERFSQQDMLSPSVG